MTLETGSRRTTQYHSQTLDPELAYRLMGEMVRRLESFQDAGRLELALLQIESIGAFLAELARENITLRLPSQWPARTTYSPGD